MDEDQEYQAIPHSDASSLNIKMKQKHLSESLELYLVRNPEIGRVVDIVSNEENDILIYESNQRFLQYLRSRVNSNSK